MTAAADAAVPSDPSPRLVVPGNRYFIYLLLAALGLSADLLTKHWVFAWRGVPRAGGEWWIVENYFGIQTALNPGALFGMGAGGGTYFALLSVVAAVTIAVWLFYFRAAHDLWLTIALGCVTAGIFGNLYDRLGLGCTDAMQQQFEDLGYSPAQIEIYRRSVRDWILLRYREEKYTWPNFNLADSLLVCGAGILIFRSLVQSREPSEDKPGPAEEVAASTSSESTSPAR